MKIGIDIDEILTEYNQSLLNFLEKTLGKKVLYEELFDCDLKDSFGMTQEEIWELLQKHTEGDRILNLKFVENSKESINFLREDHELFFITSRHPKLKEKTLFFFENHFPGHNFNILFSGDAWQNENKSKVDHCKENGVSLFIEDNPNYAFNCAQSGIKTFLLDKPWNQEYKKHPNLIKVKSWKEILERLE